jgi:hypothetical protein
MHLQANDGLVFIVDAHAVNEDRKYSGAEEVENGAVMLSLSKHSPLKEASPSTSSLKESFGQGDRKEGLIKCPEQNRRR